MYRGNKKLSRRMRRLHNEAKDEPRPWWQEDVPWEPHHVEKARDRARYKRAEQKRIRSGWKGYGRWRYLNDNGVTTSARKSNWHRRHEVKPYKRRGKKKD